MTPIMTFYAVGMVGSLIGFVATFFIKTDKKHKDYVLMLAFALIGVVYARNFFSEVIG